MGHLLKIKCVDSRVNVHILASTSGSFTHTTVQVANSALTHTKQITVPFPFDVDGCCTVQYSTIQYSTVQYSTVKYSTVKYSTEQYNIFTEREEGDEANTFFPVWEPCLHFTVIMRGSHIRHFRTPPPPHIPGRRSAW